MKKRRATHTSPTHRPTVYAIAGPNGAGKSTFATTFLPDFADCREFLNADLIAAGLAPFAPETQNIWAARLMLERMRELSAAGVDFGFETTLSGRSYVRHFEEWRQRGYRIVMFFLWLPSVELAVARVAHRVGEGGHNVPEADIRRRFSGGLRNFWSLYQPFLDSLRLYDASGYAPEIVAHADEGAPVVERPDGWTQFKDSFED